MANKPKFLKNLLTTASALAVIAGGANSAFATDTLAINPGGASQLANAAHWKNVGGNVAPVAGAANRIFLTVAQDIDFDAAIGNLGTLNIYGFDGKTLTVTANNSLQGIINDITQASKDAVTAANNGGGPIVFGGAANAKINLHVDGTAANVLFEFHANGVVDANNNVTTNPLSALGNVTLTDAGANIGTLKLNGNNVLIAGTINGAAAVGGVVEVNATNVQFGGVIGATKALGKLQINAGKSALIRANATFDTTGVTLGANSTLNVAAGVTLTGTAGAGINGIAAGDGTLAFQGAGTIDMKVGNNFKLNLVTIGNGEVDARKAVTANTILLNDDNAIFKISTNASTITANITTKTDNKGKLKINGADQEIIGKIGEQNKNLEAIIFETENKLTVVGEGAIINVNEISSGQDGTTRGTLEIKGNQDIVSDLGKANRKLTLVELDQSKAGGAAINVTLKQDVEIHATTLNLASAAAVDNTLNLEKGAKVHANVEGAAGNLGKIVIKGDSTIDGNIGAANKINTITFDTNDVTLEVTGATIQAASINFANAAVDATLALTKDQAVTTIKAPIILTKDGVGIIDADAIVTANNLLKFEGDIGTVAANSFGLKQLSATGGVNIELAGNAAINDIDIGRQNSKLILSGVNGSYLIGYTHENANGQIEITDNETLKKGSEISTKAEALNTLIINNKTLTLEDGVDIFAANGLLNDGTAGNGNLTFQGASIVDAIVGKNAAIGDITINGNKIVTFNKEVKVANGHNITVANGATVQFGADLTADKIVGSGAGNGTAEFINTAAMTVTLNTSNVANTSLQVVKFSGSDVIINKRIIADKYEFTNSKVAATVSTPGDIGSATVTTVSTTRNHNIKVSENQTVTESFGTDTHRLGWMIIDKTNDAVVDIQTSKFFMGVSTEVNLKGTVLLSKDGGNVYNIGSEALKLKAVTVTANTEERGSIYTKSLDISGGKTFTIKGDGTTVAENIKGVAFTRSANIKVDDGIKLAGVGDKIVLGDGAAIYSKVIATTASKGEVQVQGDIAILADIGTAAARFQNVNFSSTTGNKTALLDGNIHAVTTTFNDSIIRMVSDKTIDSAATLTHTQINLDNHTLTFTGGTSTGKGDLGISTVYDGTTGGNIVVNGPGSTLNMGGANSLEISLVDNSNILPDANGKSFRLIGAENNGKAIFLPDSSVKLVVIKGSRFVGWSFKGGVLTQTNNAAAAITQIFSGKDARSIEAATSIFAPVGGSSALASELSTLSDEQIVKAVDKLVNPVAADGSPGEAIEDATNTITELVTGRIDARYSGQAVSAGDDSSKIGGWGAMLAGHSKQKQEKSTSGFHANYWGGVIGFDTMANESMKLGGAVSAVYNKLKHKDNNNGDKTDINSYMLTLYGEQGLTERWALFGDATVGTNKVKTSSRRLTQTATGKFDMTSFAARLGVEYKFTVEDVAIIPTAGVAYRSNNSSGYKETGTTNQNLTVSKKVSNVVGMVAGLRANISSNMNGTPVTWGAHAIWHQDFNSNKKKTNISLDSMTNPLPPKVATLNKTRFNFGVDGLAQVDVIQVGAGVNTTVADKFWGVGGHIKVRASF